MKVKEIKGFFKEVKNVFRIRKNTPSFVVSGLMGCAVSAILIVIRD